MPLTSQGHIILPICSDLDHRTASEFLQDVLVPQGSNFDLQNLQGRRRPHWEEVISGRSEPRCHCPSQRHQILPEAEEGCAREEVTRGKGQEDRGVMVVWHENLDGVVVLRAA